MTDEEVDQILREISAEESDEGSCRWRNSISNREALEWAARAIVETLRQIRDAIRDKWTCPKCGGRGSLPASPGQYVPLCDRCDGAGRIIPDDQI